MCFLTFLTTFQSATQNCSFIMNKPTTSCSDCYGTGNLVNPLLQQKLTLFFSSGLILSSAAGDVCFARQPNSSDNNNQCFLGANGNVLSQLSPQKPGAIDNQPLVTQEAAKVGFNTGLDRSGFSNNGDQSCCGFKSHALILEACF